MRSVLRVSLLGLALPALMALPVVTPPAPRATPVAPEVTSLVVSDPAGEQVAERLSNDTTTAFSMVAVSWEDPTDAVTASVRVRRERKWGPWEHLATSDLGNSSTEAAARGATDPLWVGKADGVQVKVDAGQRRPRDLRVDLIDPGSSPADAHVEAKRPPSVATADDGRPTIISRTAWGADESLRGTCSTTGAPKAAFIHHTAGSNSYTAEGAAAQLRADYAYHTKSLGWCDLGYNFVVDKFGRIYEGRGGGVDAQIRGAHAGGFNSDTVGISALGNYDVVQPSAAMVQALGTITGWKLGRSGRNPQGTVAITASGGGGTTATYADGTSVTLPVVAGHRQVGGTACPGQYLWAQMGTIRAVAARQASITPLKITSTQVQKLVKSFYSDFLGRPADSGGLAFWASRIDRGDASAGQVANEMSRSPEWTRSVVRGLYLKVLRREPDGPGLDLWASRLQGDPSQVAAVAAQLYGSPEYFISQGRSDTGLWVKALYTDVLGRPADSGGLTTWSAHTASRGRAWVSEFFYASPESANTRVQALYRTFLGRTADSAGMQTWPGVVVRDGDIALAAYLAASHEYFLRAQSRY